DMTAIVDDSGSATMRQLDQRCSAVADGLRALGLAAGDGIGLLARNSAAFYETAVGASRLGLDVTYLNTGYVRDQIAALVSQRRLRGLVYDPEFADRVPRSLLRVVTTGGPVGGVDTIEMMAAAAPSPGRWPSRASRHVILTSGTTGEPKDVARTGGGVESLLSLLSGLPLRVRQTHLVAAPLFHAWGWLNLLLTMALSGTVVLARRFDPEGTLALIDRERCQVLIAVPTMLRRIMDLPAAVRHRYDTSCLRVVAVSGSAMSGSLASSFMDEYGDILFSLYGSTEAAFATVASPADLRDAPGTAGRPLPMVRVRVVDEQGNRARPRQTGQILVSSRDSVAADPSGRPSVRTGDLGWIDDAGRLFVVSREDDMVIVGGENVYPVLVEHALEDHPDIVEAAVVGVPDRVLGQALVAHVVVRRGGSATAGSIRDWARERLAPFQVPRRVVIHKDLPHGETGKVVKRSLVG
ncbi:MAG: AMP-binding protein, partial [Betaproteobacteria bacterium]